MKPEAVKYTILTFGCRANQADSSDLDRDLRAAGGEEASIEAADLVLVNTCSVTATAEQAARQAIRRVARLNPTARIVATGCYAVRAPSDLAALPVSSVRSDRTEPVAPVPFPAPAAPRPVPGPGTRGRTLHLLRVQTGCQERCAYCIVPVTRGPSRSMPVDEVLARVDAAVAAGFKEVTVTGVHLGSYGRDLAPRVMLADLFVALGSHASDVTFRVSAIEPMDFDDAVVAAVAGRDRFARHFHLPLQHASDRVLAAMSRPYTIEAYRTIVAKIVAACPDAAVGTDLIVGFPGETEADFEACVRYLQGSPLAYAHVFPFSPRPGTRAAQMTGRPRGEDVRRRVHHLRQVSSELARRFRARFVGSVRDGLTIEGGTLVLTDNYLRVRIPAGFRRNERVRVRIDRDGEPMLGSC